MSRLSETYRPGFVLWAGMAGVIQGAMLWQHDLLEPPGLSSVRIHVQQPCL